MREIGLETVGLWKYHVQTRLQEVMPWYVDLHQRLDSMANIFDNGTMQREESYNHKEDITKSGTDSTQLTDNNTEGGTVKNEGTNDRQGQNLFSDTPQNGLTSVKQGNYLTNATIDSDTTNVDNTETRNLVRDRSGSSSITYGSKDNHVVADFRTIKEFGFRGDKVAMLEEYQRLHLNIMEQIVKSVADCFMGILG